MSLNIISIKPITAKWRVPGFILMCALAGETYLLLHDVPILRPTEYRQTLPEITAAPIAELMSKKNGVRVQAPGQLIWEETRDGQTLYRKQSVLTLAQSRAEIAFLDGTGLVIDENSLVQLEKNPPDESAAYQRIVVTLLRGTVHKREIKHRSEIPRAMGVGGMTPQLELKVGNASAIIKPTAELTVSATPESMETGRIVVHSGEVQIDTPTGSVLAKKGETVSVPKTSSTSLAPQAPVAKKAIFDLLKPAASEAVQAASSETSVVFVWNNDRIQMAETALELEASTDPEFQKGVLKTTIGATSPPLEQVQAKLPLPATQSPVEWHWRVRALNTGATSPTEHFFVQIEPRPAPMLPQPAVEIRAGKPIDFAWSAIDSVSRYEIALRPSQEGSPSRSVFAAETHANAGLLTPGRYEWRVRGIRKDRSVSPWSDVRGFEVASAVAAPRANPAPPPPEELMDAELKESAPTPRHTSWFEKISFYAWAQAWAEGTTYEVALKWRRVAGAAKYKVQIGRDSGFKTLIAETETIDNTWSWPYRPGTENSKGRVFYRVASIDAAGQAGPFSTPKPIFIRDQLRRLSQLKERDVKRHDVYSATEGTAEPDNDPQPGLPSEDAAERLESLAKVPKPAPAPISKPASERSRPLPTVTPTPNPTPTPTSAPVAIAAPTPARPWTFSVTPSIGIGSYRQTSSDASLSSVGLTSAFLQEKLAIAAAAQPAPDRRLGFELEIAGMGFKKATGALYADQPTDRTSMRAAEFEFSLLGSRRLGERWLTFGLAADRAFRWTSDTASVLSTAAGISLGPIVAITQETATPRWYQPMRNGLGVRARVTGILTSGYYGPEGRIWSEWYLKRIGGTVISLRTEGLVTYSRWATPEGTQTLSWGVLIAPTVAFGNDGTKVNIH